MSRFLFRGQLLGGHVHVGVWAGTEQQARQQSRPRLGGLIMDPDDWETLKSLVMDRLDVPECDIEDVAPDPDPEPASPPKTPEDKIVDLMDALETSVNEAKASRASRLAVNRAKETPTP